MSSHRLLRSRCVVVAGVLLAGLHAQQPNTPSARPTWGGIDGPPWPVVAMVDVSASGAVALDVGGGRLMPFALATSSGLLTTGSSTPFGLLDLAPGGLYIFADGISNS